MNARYGLAENPALPPDLLARLISLDDRELNWHLSRRTDLSPQQRQVLSARIEPGTVCLDCSDPAPDPDVLLATSPTLTPVELFQLVKHENTLVRWALATRQDLPRKAYELLAQDEIPGVRQDVAENPAAPEEVLRALAVERDRETHRRLVHNPAVPLDVLVAVAATARVGLTLVPRIANATADELRFLAAATVPQVRMLVAEHPDLPADVLDAVAEDSSVAKSIAPNPGLSIEQLWALADRHGPRLYARIARNPGCTKELLHHLAVHARPENRTLRDIALHPNTSAETLLLCVRDERARREAAGHPNLPRSAMEELISSTT